MPLFSYKTRGGAAPEGKPRVFYARLCKTVGDDHPSTLIALSVTATVYHCCAVYTASKEQAAELQEKTYMARCHVLGETHPDTLAAMCNLANALAHLRQLKRSEELLEKAYAGYRKTLGDRHPDTENTRRAYGMQIPLQKTRICAKNIFSKYFVEKG